MENQLAQAFQRTQGLKASEECLNPKSEPQTGDILTRAFGAVLPT